MEESSNSEQGLLCEFLVRKLAPGVHICQLTLVRGTDELWERLKQHLRNDFGSSKTSTETQVAT